MTKSTASVRRISRAALDRVSGGAGAGSVAQTKEDKQWGSLYRGQLASMGYPNSDSAPRAASDAAGNYASCAVYRMDCDKPGAK